MTKALKTDFPELNSLSQQLILHADSETATKMAAYMKNHFPYLGIKAPIRKALSKDFLKEAVGKDKRLSKSLVMAMWEQPEREYHYIAIDLLEKYAAYQAEQYIRWYAELIRNKSWWDSVDALTNVVWKHFKKYPDQQIPISSYWVESGNIWLQRTAIIFQRKAREQTDWELMKRHIIACKDSSEFFIQKGIGWALREYAKTHPVRVIEFVLQTQLPPLSRREALKRLKLTGKLDSDF